MIQNLILSIGLSFAIGLNGAKDNHDYFINNDNINNVVYDDENYTITLTADELNNYTWENYYNCMTSIYIEEEDVSIWGLWLYNSQPLETDDIGSNYASYIYNSIRYNFNCYGSNFPSNTYKFYIENEDTELLNFEYSLTLDYTNWDSEYSNIKNAIELDIQANSTPSMSDFLTILNNLVTLLTGGLINMGTGLGNGLNSIVTSLALDNGGMSIFLAVIGIFGGIALAVGLTRRIFSWIESLGARR